MSDWSYRLALMTRLCSILQFSSDGTALHIQDEECELLKCTVVRFGRCQLGASDIYELLVAFANLWPELRGERLWKPVSNFGDVPLLAALLKLTSSDHSLRAGPRLESVTALRTPS